MNKLVIWIYGLGALTLFQFTTSCGPVNAQDAEAESTNTSQVDAPATRLKKQDLGLLPATLTDRSVSTTVSGRVIPANTTQVFAEVQGKIKSATRPFKAGMNFRDGETLISIESTEFAYNLESQRTAFLNVLTGILPDLKSDYPDSYPQWLDYAQNYKAGDTLKDLPEPQSTEERFYLISNQVYSLFFQIKSLEERLAKYVIKAPYTGTVTASNIDVGSLVSPGQPLGTISNSVSYEMEAGIPLSALEHLDIGDQITFVSNEVSGEWIGTVVRINNLVDPSTQNIPVFFRLRGKGLRPGMYLEGQLVTQSLNSVTLIPMGAMNRDESVLVLQEDVITRKPVQPVVFLADSIIVRGLSNGDMVILNQFEVPMEGSKVAL